MSNHTAQDLLAAVGVDWKNVVGMYKWDNGLTSTQIYTGPALNTPELDAVLLVEGQRWCVSLAGVGMSNCTAAPFARLENVRNALSNIYKERHGLEECPNPWETLLVFDNHPGHALAAAIAEVAG